MSSVLPLKRKRRAVKARDKLNSSVALHPARNSSLSQNATRQEHART
jgi:hypothetical protein